jgi:MarR family transcriptional regulator, transcriptional regulator for hemolysin
MVQAADGQDDAAMLFGRRMARAASMWRRQIDLELRPFGLTEASWRPLYYLGRLGESARQAELARALVIEGPSLVRLIDLLERDGLVLRQEDSQDRRSKLVRVTTEGRRVLRHVEAACAAVATRLLGAVSPAERAVCEALFDRIESAARAPQDAALAEAEPAGLER